MTLTEKWERFKAEQKDPGLVDKDTKVVDYACVDKSVIRESQTTEKMAANFRPTIIQRIYELKIIQRIYELNQAVENMAAKMLADNIAYSVRHHLMQARLAEAKHILKLLGQDNADQNT